MVAIAKQIGDYEMSVSSEGGTVTEFKHGDIDIFYPQQVVDGRLRGGNPVCCPYFGKLDKFPDWPRHGWFRKEELELEVWEHNKTWKVVGGPVSLKRNDYPEYVHAVLKHTLTPSGLFTGISIYSYLFVSPANPGFHPYFPTNGECLIKFGYETAVKIENGQQGEFPAKVFPFPPQGRIHIHGKSGTVNMVLSGDFSNESSVILWSDNLEKYICVEPVLGKIGEHAELGRNGLKGIELCVAFTFMPR